VGGGWQVGEGSVCGSKKKFDAALTLISYRVRTFLNSPLGGDRLASIVDTALWNSETMTRAALVNLQSYAEFSGTQFDSSIRKKVDGENQDAESV
jgi:hypothetical protein